MSGLAIPSPEQAASLPQPAKRERISPKIAKAVNLLLTGECKTQKAAAERIGTSATYLCTQLKKPAVEAFIARRTRETIAQGKMRASARLLELVDASSEHVSLDASKHVLAIEGIRPPDQGAVNVNVGVSVGYVIDLSGSQPAAKVINGTG
jgi:phage/plasmid primase-like uncharacterized protein